MNERAIDKPERISATRTGHFDLAELQAEAAFQLGVEFAVRQRDDALGFALFLGPHDGRAIALQRQNRERPRRQEMLLGAALMIALVRDGGDDARLLVVPADAADAGRLTERRARAVGGDQKFRVDRSVIGELDARCDPVRRRSPSPQPARSSTPSALARSISASSSGGFSIMCANGSPGAISPPNVRIRRPHRVLQLGVGDDHIEDRLRLAGDLVPDADGLEQPPRRRGNRRRACVAGMRLPSAGSATMTLNESPSP